MSDTNKESGTTDTSTCSTVRYPEYIYGVHESGGESHMIEAGRTGWVLELAEIGLDGTQTPANWSHLSDGGFGVIVRINHGYGNAGTIPHPDHYEDFAAACARFVQRSNGCHIWIIGNEPNHANERPDGELILPHDYARCYRLARTAIRQLPGHEQDQVLVAGSAPWNATTTYSGNEKGDWIRYFSDVIATIPTGELDGFAIHTYTHNLDPGQITGDFLHTTPGYRHRRNEFRTYREYLNAIPYWYRHLPVYITETDPTTRDQGWNPGTNVGWVQAAYKEIAEWNRHPHRQSIQALILYRWPRLADQPEWSISDRPCIIEDLKQALRAEPADDYRLPLPQEPSEPTVPEPETLLPASERWTGLVRSPLGLNLRAGPTTDDYVIRILPHESVVTTLAELDEWLYVESMGKLGYVSQAFVTRQELDPLHPVRPDEFLWYRPELRGAELAPPEADRIAIDRENAPWIDVAVSDSWNNYGALVLKLATVLEIDPAAAIAVLTIESGGQSFRPNGRMLIRFENHIFFDQWGKLYPERFAQYLRFNLERPWENHEWRGAPDQPWREFHGDQEQEWQVFDFVRKYLNDRGAKLSISMGAPQIMGFNHELLGYETVDMMQTMFEQSTNRQIIGLFDYINSVPGLTDALRKGDYPAFARSYNGEGQAQTYGNLIQETISTFNRLRAQTDRKSRLPSGLPAPEIPHDLLEADKALYIAWRNHLIQGFQHNEQMFNRILHAFMEPYNTTIWMYRILFGVGIASFLGAVLLSVWTGNVAFGLVFSGLSATTFVSYFISRPLRSLEENLNFITWLGVIYNSYWVRLLYTTNVETVQQDLKEITEEFVAQIEKLIDKNDEINQKRPGI